MQIIKFSEELLKPVAKLCRQNMEFDIMPDFLLKEKTFDDHDFDPEMSLIRLNDSQVPIGFIQAVIRERVDGKTGYIKLLCVDSNERRKGIASDLYNKIENKFVQNEVNRIRVYESYPNYFMPGIDPFYTEAICFFERKGFKKFKDTSNLKVDLLSTGFDTTKEEAELYKENIICRRAERNEKERILKWIDDKFPGWHFEVNEAFNNRPITLFITEVNGEVKAFCAHEVNNKGTGWFGPMGTDESLRGKGIGGILLKKSLADLKEMGFVNATIPWVGPIPFYMHNVNSKVDRIFWRYEKLME